MVYPVNQNQSINTNEIKSKALSAIDRRRQWLIDISKTILHNPETGFRETKTSKLVREKLDELSIEYESNIAQTGLKGFLNPLNHGPTVAILSELDSVRVPSHPNADTTTGAAHACGHHCQPGMMLGAAVGLLVPEVIGALSGRVALMAVPAEEFIDIEYRWNLRSEGKLGFLSGKQEFIRLGMFDDVDISMMAHTISTQNQESFSVGGSSNGHVVKLISFTGKSAHSGTSPHLGVNALQAALVSLNALNTQRETFANQDTVRLHGILTSGGESANAVPEKVKYEGRVRGSSEEAILDASKKMDRCLKSGALALGASVEILTIPGYLPIINNRPLMELFNDNATSMIGDNGCVIRPDDELQGGSTDMGDLSNLMPIIHPYTAGASGTGHGSDYVVDDYDKAVINPAKAIALTIIDLLANNAYRASKIVDTSPPRLSKEQYLQSQDNRLSEETYLGR